MDFQLWEIIGLSITGVMLLALLWRWYLRSPIFDLWYSFMLKRRGEVEEDDD